MTTFRSLSDIYDNPTILTWRTPAELDQEMVRWRQWKRQKGGWVQDLWIHLQDRWFLSASEIYHEGVKP